MTLRRGFQPRQVHVGVTRSPTDARVAQQLREATPDEVRPRVLVHDHDATYGPAFARVAAASGIAVIRTPVRAPRTDAVCERFPGSVRRECLDHTVLLGERHLGRVLAEYVGYVNRARPHHAALCRHARASRRTARGAPPAPPGRAAGTRGSG